jgi:hypothetical protein
MRLRIRPRATMKFAAGAPRASGIRNMVAAALSVGVTVAASAASANADSTCATGATTVGASGCYIMPAGMTHATFTATGAKGGVGGQTGDQQGGLGGAAGQVSANLSVTPGEQLNITVGGNGATGQAYTYDSTQGGAGGAGGSNGGANGGNGGGFGDGAVGVSYGGGGGGGGATTLTDPSGNLLLEAGGGGGGGANGWNDEASGGNGGCGSQNGDAGVSGGDGQPGTSTENGGLLTQGGVTGVEPWGNWSGSNNGSGGAIPAVLAVDAIGADGNPPGGGGGGGVQDGAGGGFGGLLWPNGAGNSPFWEYGGGGAGGGSSTGPAGSTYTACASGGARVQVSDLYGPPQVTAVAATSVTATGATLNTSINPENSQTSYSFQLYDELSQDLIATVPATPASVGSDDTGHSESQSVSLEPAHDYVYDVVANNAAGGAGTGAGYEYFSTPAEAPTVSTSAPTSVSGADATLNGTVNPEGSATSYYFEYGTSTQYGTQVPAGGANVDPQQDYYYTDYSNHSESTTLSNLTPDQTYDYRIVATDGTGTSDGANQTFTTLAVPQAPSDVQASAGDSQATVSFTPPASGATPSSYVVTATDQTTSGNGGQTATGSGSPVTVTGLTNGDTYTFTVTTKNAAGTGLTAGPSNAVTPMAPPAAALSLDAVDGPGEANVSFDLPAQPAVGPVTGFTLTANDLSNPANGGQVVSDTAANGCDGDAYPDDYCSEYVTGLTNGDTYTFTVALTNADESGPTAVSGSVQPAAPIIRSLSFGGTSGWFLDLYNPASEAIQLGDGWTLTDSENESGSCSKFPCEAALQLSGVTIPAGGDYLISGDGYSLGTAPDLGTDWCNYEGSQYGVKIQAPDDDISDAVGYSGASVGFGFVSGTGLSMPSDDGAATEFVRRYADGVPVDTGDNASDFVLVAPDADSSTYGGQAEQGVAAPADSGSPVMHSEFLQAGAVANGVSYTPGVAGQPGQLTVDQTITNCSGQPLSGACADAASVAAASVTKLQLQLTSLTTTGSPGAGPGQAVLVPESSTSTAAADSTCAGTGSLSLLSPSVSGTGAGLNSVWDATSQLPGITSENPSGGLAAGGCVNVQLQFAVLQTGYYSFGYNALDDLVLTPNASTAGSGNPSGPSGTSTPGSSSGTATPATVATAATPAASMVTVKGTLTSTGATASVIQTSAKAKKVKKSKPAKHAKKVKKAKKAKHSAKPRKHARRGARRAQGDSPSRSAADPSVSVFGLNAGGASPLSW